METNDFAGFLFFPVFVNVFLWCVTTNHVDRGEGMSNIYLEHLQWLMLVEVVSEEL